jgi:FtsP/CotA-like multicopper oxidase with cupredoxin domain
MKKTTLYTVLGIIIIIAISCLFIWKNTLKLSAAEASTVVELKNGDIYNMTASYVTKIVAGKPQKMLAYNGMIPGPTIKVAQGAEVTINFKNDTDLPALLHSHGVRMDNQFDGAQNVQKDIPPGGTFAYTLTFPDAGVFWYHPHVDEVYEQSLGLYGAFIVTPTDANYYPPVNQEVSLFLSDLPVDDSGNITLTKNTNDHTLMGHYGNVMLVNGQENYTFSAKTGEVVQLDVINAANARPYNFAIAGAKLKIVGSDNGAYEKAFYADSVTLGPSERAIIDVLFTKPGEYEIQNKTPEQTYSLGNISVSTDAATTSYASQFNMLQENKTVEASIAPFLPYINKASDKKLKLTVDMPSSAMSSSMGGGMMMPDGTMMGGMGSMSPSPDGVEWEDDMPMMGSMTTDTVKWKIVDQDTGKSNMDINWTLAKDVPVKIEIYNDPNSAHPMQHPIHFHGNRFLVVSRNGVPQTDLVWKDTVLVKSGETVDIVLDTSNPGTWMAHCHTAEHLQDGMMFTYKVE